jgi:hypothetical protein
MRPTNFPPKVLAAAISVCTSESVNLNSERIRHRFGSCGIDVLADAEHLRHTSLYSLDGATKTCRTYAIVRFADQRFERAGEEHAQVLAGRSIGAIFKESGWTLQKQTLYVGTIRLPGTATRVSRLMRLSGQHDLALHIYQLVMIRKDVEFEYATIMEAHHPEYLSTADLSDLYTCDASVDLAAEDLAQLSALLLGTGNHDDRSLSQ